VLSVAGVDDKLGEPPIRHFFPDLAKKLSNSCDSLWVSHMSLAMNFALALTGAT